MHLFHLPLAGQEGEEAVVQAGREHASAEEAALAGGFPALPTWGDNRKNNTWEHSLCLNLYDTVYSSKEKWVINNED